MNWLLNFAGVKAYVAFAAVLAILAALWFAQVAGLRAEVSDAKSATALAEKKLSDRIAAEATVVAAAVSQARDEEHAKQRQQEVAYEQLLETHNTTRANLVGAEQRLRKLAAEATRRESDSDTGDRTQAADRVAETAADELRPEDRILIDDLLRIAGDARQAAEERNWLSNQYITQCERK